MLRGYDRALYILPFDHRGSFQAKMFGWKSPLSEAQTAEISRAKAVIYDGFNAAPASGLPKHKTGILVDEQFGAGILAKRYREFVDLFERATTRLSSELSDRTRSGHHSSKEA
jgi:hypothetical protein